MKIQASIVANSTRRLERAYSADLLRRLSPTPESVQAAADTLVNPKRRALVARYVRDTRTPTDVYAYERAIGTNDLLSIDYFWKGLRASRAVARIVISPTPGIPGEMATGFLVAPNVLLTNWHVFEDDLAMAARAHAQFSYEADRDGRERQSTSFRINPSTFFCSDKNLDYCFVAVEPASREGPEGLESFGWLRLNPQLGKTDYGQFLSIIQHPGGQPKQVAIRENRMLPFDDRSDFLSYQSDTLRGSSGAPVFNDYWDVVALHHSGKPLLDTEGHYLDHDGRPIMDHEPQEDEIQWVANEGARVSRIVTDCLQRAQEGAFKEGLRAVIEGQLPPSEAPNEGAPIGGDTSMHLPNAGGREHAVIIVPLDVDIRLGRGSASATSVTTQTTQPTTQPRALTTASTDAGATLEKLNFDPDYLDRRGYDEVFLGGQRRVPMPVIDQGHTNEIAPTKQGGKQLDYHHFSVVMHKQRRVAIFSACNVDYRAVSRDERARDDFGKDQWITDDRMDSNWQIPKAFYDRWKKLDYGHLVRRDDNCWGATRDEVEFSNADTFHMTNCTPQHEAFNRDRFGYHGLWGRIENAIAEQATRDGTISRLCIFAGPIFQPDQYLTLDDPDVGPVWVPFSFWKVVACPARRGGLQVFGFIASQKKNLQTDPPFEDFVADEFTSQQVSLTAIEAKTLVRFDQSLKTVDVMANRQDNGGHESLVIRDTNEIFMGNAPTLRRSAHL